MQIAEFFQPNFSFFNADLINVTTNWNKFKIRNTILKPFVNRANLCYKEAFNIQKLLDSFDKN